MYVTVKRETKKESAERTLFLPFDGYAIAAVFCRGRGILLRERVEQPGKILLARTDIGIRDCKVKQGFSVESRGSCCRELIAARKSLS